MGIKLDSIINENYNNLNQIDIHILSYVKTNISECVNLSISDLAKKCNVSSSTILRMTQKLGFSGYSEFKYFLKNDSKKEKDACIDTVELINQDIAQTNRVFLRNKQINDIYELFYNADHIYAYGTGLGQRLMLEEFARCFMNVNRHVVLIQGTGELKIVSNNISKKDIILIASYSGNVDKYRDSLMNLEITGVPIISITNLENNELSSVANYNLYFQNSFKNKDLNISRSSYLTLHLVLHLLYDGYVKYLNEIESKD